MRCLLAHHFTVNKAMAWRGAVFDDPPYQRQGSVWSMAKQQRFVDTLLNGFDVPKIYLHDLRGRHPTKVYAVVDGKQRLNTIWRFLADEIALAPDFHFEAANAPNLPPGTRPPKAHDRFSQLDPAWQQVVRSRDLSVVLIQDATEEDIEELFARLNNGAPLNAAEKRNARGGAMARLVRQTAARPFFRTCLAFADVRYRHLELAARLLLVERSSKGTGAIPDLGGSALDAFVEAGRVLSRADRTELAARVDAGLERMERVFTPGDPLLGRPGQALLHYLVVRAITAEWPDNLAAIRPFLVRLQREASAGELVGRSGRLGSVDPATGGGWPRANDRRRLAREVDAIVDRFRSERLAAGPAA